MGLEVSFSTRCAFHSNTHPASFRGGSVKNDEGRAAAAAVNSSHTSHSQFTCPLIICAKTQSKLTNKAMLHMCFRNRVTIVIIELPLAFDFCWLVVSLTRNQLAWFIGQH